MTSGQASKVADTPRFSIWWLLLRTSSLWLLKPFLEFSNSGATVGVGCRVSLIDFRLVRDSSGYILVQEASSAIFQHGELSYRDLLNVREYCTGLGALGLGAEQAGFRIVTQNEIQEPTAPVAQAVSGLQVVQGDVGSSETLKRVWDLFSGHATTAAGVACQPYSLLGDRRGGRNPRSATLPNTLRAAWLLQSPLVVLECVTPAAADEHVRKCLEDFTTKSGFSIHEVTLELKDVWPSARCRWWCVLASQELGGFQIKGWRPHGAWRTVADALECPNVGLS